MSPYFIQLRYDFGRQSHGTHRIYGKCCNDRVYQGQPTSMRHESHGSGDPSFRFAHKRCHVKNGGSGGPKGQSQVCKRHVGLSATEKRGQIVASGHRSVNGHESGFVKVDLKSNGGGVVFEDLLDLGS